jgi:hypothetical protein
MTEMRMLNHAVPEQVLIQVDVFSINPNTLHIIEYSQDMINWYFYDLHFTGNTIRFSFVFDSEDEFFFYDKPLYFRVLKVIG